MTPVHDIPKNSIFDSFIKETLGLINYKIDPIAGDVSSRRYFRVSNDNKSWILMDWEPFKSQENYPFLSIQSFWNTHGIKVPKIFGYKADKGIFLIEDLGDLTLERKFWEVHNKDNYIPYYKLAIDELIKIISTTNNPSESYSALSVEFDIEKFMWEFSYAKKYLLEFFLKLNPNNFPLDKLESEFRDLSKKLLSQKKVICHRDFHSRNIMVKTENVRIIDFQDARMGPIQYDIVSLLADSYTNIDESTETYLLDYFYNAIQSNALDQQSKDSFLSFYELQIIQRCFKACGTFAAVLEKRNDKRYLRHVPSTLLRIKKSLEIHNYPTLNEFVDQTIDKSHLFV